MSPEIVVGIEESASYVEDMWPDEVAYLAARQVTELRAAVEAELALVIEPVGPFDSGAAAAYHHVLSILPEAPRACCADKGGEFCRDTTGLDHCVDGPEGFVYTAAGDKAEAPPTEKEAPHG